MLNVSISGDVINVAEVTWYMLYAACDLLHVIYVHIVVSILQIVLLVSLIKRQVQISFWWLSCFMIIYDLRKPCSSPGIKSRIIWHLAFPKCEGSAAIFWPRPNWETSGNQHGNWFL